MSQEYREGYLQAIKDTKSSDLDNAFEVGRDFGSRYWFHQGALFLFGAGLIVMFFFAVWYKQYWLYYLLLFGMLPIIAVLIMNWKVVYEELVIRFNPKYARCNHIGHDNKIRKHLKNISKQPFRFGKNDEPRFVNHKVTTYNERRGAEYFYVRNHPYPVDFTKTTQRTEFEDGSIIVGTLTNASHLDQIMSMSRERAEAKKDTDIVGALSKKFMVYFLVILAIVAVTGVLMLTVYNEWRVLFPDGVGDCQGIKCLYESAVAATSSIS